ELLLLAAMLERVLELEGMVEMILDRGLVATGHENELLDASGLRLLDGILDQRLIDDGEHFLRHGLCRRQKPGPEAAHRENRLADALGHGGCVFALGKSGQAWPKVS